MISEVFVVSETLSNAHLLQAKDSNTNIKQETLLLSSSLQYVLCIHLHFHRPSDLKGDYIILSWRYISSAWNKAYGSTAHSHCIIAASRKTSYKHSFHIASKKNHPLKFTDLKATDEFSII